jgi:hypothetical protein
LFIFTKKVLLGDVVLVDLYGGMVDFLGFVFELVSEVLSHLVEFLVFLDKILDLPLQLLLLDFLVLE